MFRQNLKGVVLTLRLCSHKLSTVYKYRYAFLIAAQIAQSCQIRESEGSIWGKIRGVLCAELFAHLLVSMETTTVLSSCEPMHTAHDQVVTGTK